MPVYHRLQSPSQSRRTAEQQRKSGEVWGRAPWGSDIPTDQAFVGPLPARETGVQFETDVEPSKINPLSLEVRWRLGDPGVMLRSENGEDFAAITVTVTKIV